MTEPRPVGDSAPAREALARALWDVNRVHFLTDDPPLDRALPEDQDMAYLLADACLAVLNPRVSTYSPADSGPSFGQPDHDAYTCRSCWGLDG